MESVKQQTRPIVLADCKKELLGLPIAYSLWLDPEAPDGCYHIEAVRGSEKCECCVGDDVIKAVKLFEAIVAGQVFPYSLSEIVEDFWKE